MRFEKSLGFINQ